MSDTVAAIRAKMAFDAIAFAAATIAQHRDFYQKLDEQRRYMDNVGGLLDPTLYRNVLYSKVFEGNKAAADAALAFLRAIEAIPAWAMAVDMLSKPAVSDHPTDKLLDQMAKKTTAADLISDGIPANGAISR